VCEKHILKTAMTSQRGLVILKDVLGGGGNLVALPMDNTRLQCIRFGLQGVESGVYTSFSNRTRWCGDGGGPVSNCW